MSSKMLLSALAVVAAIALVGAAQDPTFDYPVVKHVGFDLPQDDFTPTIQAGQKVSVSFRNATVREVLDWLKNSGVNFVVGDDQLDKDSRININVANQPVDALMRALASAWSGHWDRKGDMWVFHKGANVFGETPDVSVFTVPGTKDSTTRFLAPKPGSGAYKVFTGTGDQPYFPGSDAQAKQLEPLLKMRQDELNNAMKGMKDLNDPKAWADFQKNWEKWAHDYEKNFQDFEKNFKDKNFDFKFDDKQVEELTKQAEDMAKSAEGLRMKMKPGGAGAFVYDGKDLKPFDETRLRELGVEARTLGKSGDWSPMVFESHQDLKGLYLSLTETQRAKMEKDGFLRYSDLSAKQRAMLGSMGGGTWELTYKSGSNGFTIKSDH